MKKNKRRERERERGDEGGRRRTVLLGPFLGQSVLLEVKFSEWGRLLCHAQNLSCESAEHGACLSGTSVWLAEERSLLEGASDVACVDRIWPGTVCASVYEDVWTEVSDEDCCDDDEAVSLV